METKMTQSFERLEKVLSGIDQLRAENALLKNDCLTLALRLISEPDDSHAPETLEVMRRWHPALDALISGGHSRESAIARAALSKREQA